MHAAQVAGGVEHVAGEAVSQHVRMHVLEHALALGQLADADLHGALRDRGASAAREDRRVVRRLRFTAPRFERSEEHTSELQSLMRSSYAVFCLKKKKRYKDNKPNINHKHTAQV